MSGAAPGSGESRLAAPRIWRGVALGGLGLFGLDALASLPGSNPVGSLLGGLLLVGAPILALLSLVLPRIPARLAWPPALFVGWALLGAMPLPLWTWDTGWHISAVSLVQLALCGLLALIARSLGPWEARPLLSWRRTAGLGVAATVGLPLLLGGYAWGSAAALLHALTGGYAGLDLHGVYLTERTFERGETTVHLVGMMHVGEQRRYEELYAAFGELDHAVVLAEGVTDREGLFGDRPGYARAAGRLDLVEQPPLDNQTLAVHRTDIDVSDLSDETRQIVRAALGVWGADDPLAAYLSMTRELGDRDEAASRALIDRLWHDLVELRNQRVLLGIAQTEPEFAHVVVPWGAIHLPGIAAALQADGWTPRSSTKRPLLGYGKLLP